MGIPLHPMITGQPLRIKYLQRALTEMRKRDGVWFATLRQVADHALATGHVRYRPHPDLTIASRP